MIKPTHRALVGLVLCALFWSRPALAQNANAGSGRARPSARSVAPPPIAPATVSRTADGGITVRAVRITEPLKIDGRLDERVYSEVPPISDFIQQEPREGSPATERTEAWIFFDDHNVYVSARCLDSHPEREIANEMRRDSNNIIQNESFTIYRPGSELFVVYSDGRDTTLKGFPTLVNRAFIVKITKLFRL